MNNVPQDQPQTAVAQAQQRLDQFEAFLAQDPGNDALLADAFTTALQAAEWSKAAIHLQRGLALGVNPLPWALREGDLCLAQGDVAQARQVYETLRALPDTPVEFQQTVLQNLAYIDFQVKDFGACVSRLESGMEPAPGLKFALSQTLWLRALHRTGELKRACDWASATMKLNRLVPAAAGIASLIALDAGDMASAQGWSMFALQGRPEHDGCLEALVTQASLALAARDAKLALAFAAEALRISPNDGRAWSVHAFADLLAGKPEAAKEHFAKALEVMPGHIGTWHGRAWTELVLRDFDEALASFESALELDRNFAESHGGLAVILALRNNRPRAEEHMERARRLDKANLSGRYAQAILSGEARDNAAMQRMVAQILTNGPAR